METMSEKLLELKESGRLRALKRKWFTPSEKQKEMCDAEESKGDQFIVLETILYLKTNEKLDTLNFLMLPTT